MKNWDKEEILRATELNQNGLKYKEIAIIIGRTEKSVRLKLNRLGFTTNELAYYEIKLCECCGDSFKSLKSDERKYCSQSCSGKINGIKHPKRVRSEYKLSNCINCNEKLTSGRSKYCSQKCQIDYNQKEYIIRWKNGDENGSKGCDSLSKFVRRYLFEKYNYECCKCGWKETNNLTGLIPLQVHHVNGDCNDNIEDNLELLCPNCHSLTETHGSLNRGKSTRTYIKLYRNGDHLKK